MNKFYCNKNSQTFNSKSMYNKDDYYSSNTINSSIIDNRYSTFNINEPNLTVNTLTATNLIHSLNKITTSDLIIQNSSITSVGLNPIILNGIVNFTKDVNIGTLFNTDLDNNVMTFNSSVLLNLGNFVIDKSNIYNNTSNILLSSSTNNIIFKPKIGGSVLIDSLTNSFSINSGALIIRGGLGVAHNIYSTDNYSTNIYSTNGQITNLYTDNLDINAFKFYDIGTNYSYISPNLDPNWNDIVITPKNNTFDIKYQFSSTLFDVKNSIYVHEDATIGSNNTNSLDIYSNTSLKNDVTIGEDNTDILTINSTANTNILTCSNTPVNPTDVLRLQDVKIDFTSYTQNYYFDTSGTVIKGTVDISAICDVNNIVSFSIDTITGITDETNSISYIKIDIPNAFTPSLQYTYFNIGNNGTSDNKILLINVKTDNTIIITPIFDISNNSNNNKFEIGVTYSINSIFISYLKN